MRLSLCINIFPFSRLNKERPERSLELCQMNNQATLSFHSPDVSFSNGHEEQTMRIQASP